MRAHQLVCSDDGLQAHNEKQTFPIGVFSAISNLLMLVPSLYMLQVYDRVLPAATRLPC
jgi:ABC-type protease/lipase transport system fused ATPase/permease subunit